jgi:hypothetical protein
VKRMVRWSRVEGCSACERYRAHKVSGGGDASLDEGNDEVEKTTMTAMTTEFLPDLRRRGLSHRGFWSKVGHGFPSCLASKHQH